MRLAVPSQAKQSLVLALSEDYERRTGGWTYANNIAAGLRRRGWTVRELTLPAGFPDPDRSARQAAAATFAALPDDTIVLVDQICLSVLPEVAAREGRRLRLIMIVHHPLALELGRLEGERLRLSAAERSSLGQVTAALTTSRTVATILAEQYGVPCERLLTAPPGIDRKPLASGSPDGVPLLLSVGAIVPRKNHGAIVEALGGLADRRWRLVLAGNRTRAAAHVAELRARVAELGLSNRVSLPGEIEERELAALWRTADLYLSASTFEGYGSAIAEAVSAGLPVVATSAGAVAEWLSPDVAVLVPVGDVPGLRAAIARVLDEPDLRSSLRAGALAARAGLPTWTACVATIEAALRSLKRR